MTPPSLRIALFGNRGYASALLAHLLDRGEHVAVVVTRTTRTGGLRSLASRLRDTAFRGGAERCADPFAAFTAPVIIARRHGIPVLDADTVRSGAFALALRSLAPDIGLVAGFHRKIPSSVIGIPAQRMVNFHPSLLPRHRGGTPNRWVVRLGEWETGVTAHFVTDAFDAGAIVGQERVPVGPRDTWGAVESRIVGAVLAAADRVLADLRAGTLQGTPQDDRGATFEPPYHDAHQRIDWSCSADEIRRTCDAIRPKAGGMSSYRGAAVEVWEGDRVSVPAPDAPPGTVIAVDDHGCPIIACGDGAFRVTTCVRRGRIVPASVLVRSLGIAPGHHLGS